MTSVGQTLLWRIRPFLSNPYWKCWHVSSCLPGTCWDRNSLGESRPQRRRVSGRVPFNHESFQCSTWQLMELGLVLLHGALGQPPFISVQLTFGFLDLFYSFERPSYRARERAGSFPEWHRQPGQGQAQVRALPHRTAGTCCLPRSRSRAGRTRTRRSGYRAWVFQAAA